jgi:hypothetical protein
MNDFKTREAGKGKMSLKHHLSRRTQGQVQWLIFVIPATWEVETERTAVPG